MSFDKVTDKVRNDDTHNSVTNPNKSDLPNEIVEIVETAIPGEEPHKELPPVIVWDYDLKRDGETGGFFLSEDEPLVAQRYSIPDAPTGPGWHERTINAKQKIPGRYLPDPTHFIILQCGKLQKVVEPSEFSPDGTTTRFRLRALAVARDVRDAFENDQYALVRLSIRGVAAIKLATYFNQLPRVAQRISALLTKQAGRPLRISPQKIWVPVSVARAVPLGRNGQQIGALPDVDVVDPKTGRFHSRWEAVEDQFLSATFSAGGYIADRQDLERIKELATRAAELSAYVVFGEQNNENEQKAEQHVEDVDAHGIPTPESLQKALLNVGLKPDDPRVQRRLEEFGATSIEELTPAHRLQFASLIEDFRLRARHPKVA